MILHWWMFSVGTALVLVSLYLIKYQQERLNLRFISKCTGFIVLLGVLDVVSTINFVIKWGIEYESNLFLVFLVNSLGLVPGLIIGFIYIKIIVVFSFITICFFLWERKGALAMTIILAYMNIRVTFINFGAVSW